MDDLEPEGLTAKARRSRTHVEVARARSLIRLNVLELPKFRRTVWLKGK